MARPGRAGAACSHGPALPCRVKVRLGQPGPHGKPGPGGRARWGCGRSGSPAPTAPASTKWTTVGGRPAPVPAPMHTLDSPRFDQAVGQVASPRAEVTQAALKVPRDTEGIPIDPGRAHLCSRPRWTSIRGSRRRPAARPQCRSGTHCLPPRRTPPIPILVSCQPLSVAKPLRQGCRKGIPGS